MAKKDISKQAQAEDKEAVVDATASDGLPYRGDDDVLRIRLTPTSGYGGDPELWVALARLKLKRAHPDDHPLLIAEAMTGSAATWFSAEFRQKLVTGDFDAEEFFARFVAKYQVRLGADRLVPVINSVTREPGESYEKLAMRIAEPAIHQWNSQVSADI